MGERMWSDQMQPHYLTENVAADGSEFFYQNYSYLQDFNAPNMENNHQRTNNTNLEYLSPSMTVANADTGQGQMYNMDQTEFIDNFGVSMGNETQINEVVVEFAQEFEDKNIKEKKKNPNESRRASESATNSKAKSKLNENKTCRVCGDKALGYNFNVITCESCKAFFRRNALKKKTLRCPSKNNCTVTVSSRRCCQKCRLRKCFEVGMKPEYIMTEEQRAEKRRRLMSRGADWNTPDVSLHDQQSQDELGDSSDDHEDTGSGPMSVIGTHLDDAGQTGPQSITPETGVVNNNFQIVQDSLNSLFDHQPTTDFLVSPQPLSTGSSTGSHRSSLASGQEDTVELTIRVPRKALVGALFNNTALGRVVLSSIGPSHEPGSSMGRPAIEYQGPDGYSGLQITELGIVKYRNKDEQEKESRADGLSVLDTDSLDLDALDSLAASMDIDNLPILSPDALAFNLKLAKLDELFAAIRICHDKIEVPNIPSKADDFTSKDFFNLIQYGLQRIIKMFSRLSGLKQLPMDDRSNLLKSSFNELNALCKVHKLDLTSELMPVDCEGKVQIELAVIKRIRGGLFYHGFKALVASFPEKWRRDTSLILILSSMALFNPDTPNLINRAAVETERRAYLQLLKDYLESTYGTQEANWAYEYLTERVNTLRSYTSQFCYRLNFDVDPQTFDIVLHDVRDFA